MLETLSTLWIREQEWEGGVGQQTILVLLAISSSLC